MFNMPKTDSEQTIDTDSVIAAAVRKERLFVARISRVRLVVAACFLFVASSAVHAACSDEELLISRDLATKAAESDNDTVRLLLLKRSVDECSAYPVWLELGKLQMQMDNPFDAVYAFEHAVDFQPNASNGVTPDQLLRRAIGNARLAEAYQASGELAMALVATQEAVDAFDVLNQPVPRRLVQLQARLDDAVSQTDADVMVRSIEVQQDRASRGIGVSPRLLDPVEDRDAVIETLTLLSDYSGDPVASPEELGIEIPVFDETADADGQIRLVRPVRQETEETSTARLNIPVLFKFDSAELTDESRVTIGQLAAALARLDLGKDDTVMVIGHTDSRGTATYNMKLSRDRAEAVADVLSSMLKAQSADGIKLQYQGRGESELRYQGEQADDHRRNRRVEVVVTQQP